jgi:spore cortex formation protein SpoVR/YcgB (stage V sporulation)
VAAHACFGHNSLFKNNYLFKQWTHPDAIVDYSIFARDYVAKCEELYGWDRVEKLLDAAFALEYHGIDKYKRPPELSMQEEKEQQQRRMEERQKDVSWLWNILPGEKTKEKLEEEKFPKEPEENFLYFLEKNSSVLDTWEREILRIVRKTAQYFYPQQQTKLINEGWASYIHHSFLYRLFELGYVTDGFMQSFLTRHTGVLAQFDYNT